jgi:hypothetical protein
MEIIRFAEFVHRPEFEINSCCRIRRIPGITSYLEFQMMYEFQKPSDSQLKFLAKKDVFRHVTPRGSS